MNNYQCIQCGGMCQYRWSICEDCQRKAKKEKEDYLKSLGYKVKENEEKV